MSIAMFVLAIVFLFFVLATVACLLLDYYGDWGGLDPAIPGITSLIIAALLGITLSVLAIINFGVSV